MSIDVYAVEVDVFAEKHYEKKFVKKYKTNWDTTIKSLKKMLSNPSIVLARSMGEVITQENAIQICKIEFRIAGTKTSRKSSGNRCIISVDNELKNIRVLLIYHKSYLPKSRGETLAWKKMIKDNFSEYKHML